ncbi:hypothetical protein ACSBR2_042423 [Camellia fascicularis]
MLMSSINGGATSAVIEKSETNECCISEQELVSLIKRIVAGAQKTDESESFASIYRVPKEIRKRKESAYTPRCVSIGPLHSKDQHILNSPFQNVKKTYANTLFGRISSEEGGSEEEKLNKSKVSMQCLRKMKESLDEVKKCYAEDVGELNEEMLVIDGCFILELLYKSKYKSYKSNDPIFGNILMPTYIQHDLLLLENQLPFFVLKELFNLTVAECTPTTPTLDEYVIPYIRGMWKPGNNETTTNNNYNHILDIVHKHYLDHDAKPPSGGHNVAMPCASSLEYAGVIFKEGNKVEFCKPQGPFDRAHFKIPTLDLYDSVEPFLRNLIAYEQCCPGVPGYFTSYAFLMDTLINTPRDVQVLEKAGIIRNYLGASEDASNLFNNLCKEIVLVGFYFTETTTAATDYSKGCWHDAMAHLRRRYFATPWTFIAFCAGFITFGISTIKFVLSTFR